MWSKCGAVFLLAGGLFQDRKKGMISVRWLVLNGMLSAFAAYFSNIKLDMYVVGILPGAILMMAALITGECIGKGDAGMTLVLGLYVGLWECFTILLLACAVCAVWGGSLLAARKISVKRKVIFTPFLCLGYGIWWLLCQI